MPQVATPTGDAAGGGIDGLGNSTVYVGGLDPGIMEDQLRLVFSPFGEVASVRVLVGKACGFVQYAQRASAEAAIASMNGQMLGSQRLKLSWGRLGQARPSAATGFAPPELMQYLAHQQLVGHQQQQTKKEDDLYKSLSVLQLNAEFVTGSRFAGLLYNGGGLFVPTRAAFGFQPISPLLHPIPATSGKL
jgi:RNA recognition motif-containing protein